MTSWRVRMPGGIRSGVGSSDYESSKEAQAGWKALEAEAARSRRNHRSFAVVAVPVERQLIASIKSLLRTPDRAWIDGSVAYILLTECDSSQSGLFLRRLRSSMAGTLPLERASVAVFPEDAVTVGALLTRLRTGPSFQFDSAPADDFVPTLEAPTVDLRAASDRTVPRDAALLIVVAHQE